MLLLAILLFCFCLVTGYYQEPAGAKCEGDNQLGGHAEASTSKTSRDSPPLSQEELRERRLAFLTKTAVSESNEAKGSQKSTSLKAESGLS